MGKRTKEEGGRRKEEGRTRGIGARSGSLNSIYKLTKIFPREEVFGLTAQMRRAAVSVGANIAEGFAKKGKPDKARLMNVAQASLEEVRYYFILARDLGYVTAARADFGSVDEVGRLLGGYVKGMQAHS